MKNGDKLWSKMEFLLYKTRAGMNGYEMHFDTSSLVKEFCVHLPDKIV